MKKIHSQCLQRGKGDRLKRKEPKAEPASGSADRRESS
jgi:hypothetical protein